MYDLYVEVQGEWPDSIVNGIQPEPIILQMLKKEMEEKLNA